MASMAEDLRVRLVDARAVRREAARRLDAARGVGPATYERLRKRWLLAKREVRKAALALQRHESDVRAGYAPVEGGTR